MIVLRVVGPDDWPVWRALRLRALAEAPDAFGSTLADWQDAPEQRWRARLAAAHNLVALDGDRHVGMASGTRGDDGTPQLISLWVDPAARGRDVGDALVGGVAAWARARGAERLQLDVRTDNAAARRFYERSGFTAVGVKEGDDRGHQELVLELPL